MKQVFKSKKLTALFLCFALLFPLCSIGAFGLELPKPEERPVIPYALRDCEETETFRRRLPGEEKDLDTIVFLAEEGKRAMYLFSEPVKYVDENGETVDKDLTLVKTDGGYTAKANDIALLLPERLSDGVSLSYNGNGFALRPTEGGEESAAELTKENTVLYPDAFGAETALRYTPVFSGFKEDILLYRNVGKSSFSFTLISDTLVPFTDEAGALFFCDRESGEPLFRADDILCHDAKDYCFTGALTAEPTGEENAFLLTVSVDPAILDDPELSYPVTVDPSFSFYGNNTSPKGILDATLAVNSLYSSGTSTIAYADNYNSANRSYILVSFPVLETRHAFFRQIGATIESAILKMKCSSKGASCTGTEISLYIGSTWTEANIPTSTSHTSPYVDTAAPSVGSYSNFNLTSHFSSSTMNVNKGVFIRARSSASDGYIDYYTTESSSKPYLTIKYSVGQTTGIVSGHSYVLQNLTTKNFARLQYANSFVTCSDEHGVNAINGAPLDQHLFTIVYDSYYGCYSIHKYGDEFCCWNGSTSGIYAGEDTFLDDDLNCGWYIIYDSSDGTYQFVPDGYYSQSMSNVNGLNLEINGNNSSGTNWWKVFLSVNAINIKQQQENSCSAASLLQLIYSTGMESVVSGSTVAEKEMALIPGLGLSRYWVGDPQTGHWYYPPGNNEYVFTFLANHNLGHTYSRSPLGNSSNLATAIFNSLKYGSACVALCNAPYELGYYPSTYTDGHFICICGSNIANSAELLINDCTDWEAYNGLHIDTAQNLYAAFTVLDYAIN